MDKKNNFLNRQKKELIGKGNYGTVYKMDNNESEDTAVKVIQVFPKNGDFNEILGKSNCLELEEKTSQLFQEIEMLYKMKGQTHIVNYIDHYVEKKEDHYTIYIEMEFLKKLDDFYCKTINTEQILAICYDMLDALELCENQNIVHGDIKPQNIMIDNHGNHKLTDFGISKVMNEHSRANECTIAYAAPEVIENKKYTKQSDLYSLALVIYQLFNDNMLPFLKKNFKKKDFQISISKRIHDKIPNPIHGTEEFNKFLMRALNKDASQRYQSAHEMKEALQILEENDRIPNIVVALPIFLSLTYKFNEFNVYALSTKMNQPSLINTIRNLSKTMKICIGLSLAISSGAGVYLFLNNQSIRSIETNLNADQLNVLETGSSIQYKTIPDGLDVDISFNDNSLEYNQKIISHDINVVPVLQGKQELLFYGINDNIAYYVQYLGGHETTVYAIDISTSQMKYKSSVEGIASNNIYINEEGNLVVSNGFSDAVIDDDGTVSTHPTDQDFLYTRRIDNLIVDDVNVSYQDVWSFNLSGGMIISATHDEENNILLYYNNNPQTLNINGQDLSIEKGYSIIKINNNGKELSHNSIEFDTNEYNEAGYNISSYDNYYFITNKSDLFIYDTAMNLVYKKSFDTNQLSTVFNKGNDTLEFYMTSNENKYEGLISVKLKLTNLNLQGTKYPVLIVPSEQDIIECKKQLYSLVNPIVQDKYYDFLSWYGDFIYYISAKNTSHGPFNEKDFNALDVQQSFLACSEGILNIDGLEGSSIYNENNGVVHYRLKASDCSEAIKKYLGVEPLIPMDQEYYEFDFQQNLDVRSSFYPYMGGYFNDTDCRCNVIKDGEYTTIQIVGNNPAIYNEGFVLVEVKIKVNENTKDFTIISGSYYNAE